MSDVTRLLYDIEQGTPEAADKLLPLVYEQLRLLAQHRMAHERAGHSLQATALVHEAYLRLVDDQDMRWANRGHFFAAAAEAMRRILVESARRRGRIKRGGDRQKLALSVADLAETDDPSQILALDEALQRLEKQDERMSRIVKLRFFSGLSVEETARAMNISPRTVKREWALARAWLYQAMMETEPS